VINIIMWVRDMGCYTNGVEAAWIGTTVEEDAGGAETRHGIKWGQRKRGEREDTTGFFHWSSALPM
jgi:hypothetical protein